MFLKLLASTVLWPCVDSSPLSAAVDGLFSSEPDPAWTPLQIEAGSAGWYRRHLHTTFLVRTDTGTRASLRLTSVVDRTVCSRIEQFSLIFHAPDGTKDLHGTCACEHRTLGHFDLFIVPLGPATSRPRVYEACFTRFLPSSGVEG